MPSACATWLKSRENLGYKGNGGVSSGSRTDKIESMQKWREDFCSATPVYRILIFAGEESIVKHAIQPHLQLMLIIQSTDVSDPSSLTKQFHHETVSWRHNAPHVQKLCDLLEYHPHPTRLLLKGDFYITCLRVKSGQNSRCERHDVGRHINRLCSCSKGNCHYD